MSTVAVFIFDEIFSSMTDQTMLSALKAEGAEVHIIGHRIKLAEYAPLYNPETTKILCINPDFIEWSLASKDYKNIPGLKHIISSSDNISWLDSSYADDNKIMYSALTGLTSEYTAVAEYAITVMTSLARNIPLLMRDNFPLDLAHDFVKYQAIDLAGKTVGIVGLGNIGGAIATLCNGLGMNIVYWSRSKKPVNHTYIEEIDDLLKVSDVIFPTLKPNSDTKILLPNSKLELLKNDAIIVSVVNGLVDNDYLIHRVEHNTLFGFGFGADPSSFSKYKGNVWAVPDYAWATQNNMRQSYNQFVDIITNSVKQLRANQT